MRLRIFTLLGFVVLLAACQPSMTLQRYFVEKTEDADFLVMNIPLKMEEFFNDSMPDTTQETLESVRKINMLMFQNAKSKPEKMQQEIALVSQIFEQDRYQELMSFRSKNRQGALMVEGQLDAINEGILWYTGVDDVLIIVRFLGNQMDPKNFGELLRNLDREAFEDRLEDQLAPMIKALENQETPTLQSI